MRISPGWPRRMLSQQRVWQLSVSQSVLVQAYRSITESILTPSITVWYGSASHRSKWSVSFKPLRVLQSHGCTASFSCTRSPALWHSKDKGKDDLSWLCQLGQPPVWLTLRLTHTRSNKVKVKRQLTVQPSNIFSLLILNTKRWFIPFKLIKTRPYINLEAAFNSEVPQFVLRGF